MSRAGEYSALCCVVLCCVALCCVLLCCVALCCVVLRCAVLCGMVWCGLVRFGLGWGAGIVPCRVGLGGVGLEMNRKVAYHTPTSKGRLTSDLSPSSIDAFSHYLHIVELRGVSDTPVADPDWYSLWPQGALSFGRELKLRLRQTLPLPLSWLSLLLLAFPPDSLLRLRPFA